ncbi:hypothetical protein EBQ81_05095 [bacterium]|nr:hypothetical protein [bacterium]
MNFEVKINLVVLSTDLPTNKKYILSLSPDEIILPTLSPSKKDTININKYVIDYLQSLKVSSHNIILVPQIISIDSKYIDSNMETLNPVFGFVVDYFPNIIDSYWNEFDYTIPNKYSNLIVEVVQKIQ